MKYPGSRKRRPDSSRLFVASLEQAVLAFLCENPERSFYSVELSDDAGLSRGGVNQALHVLAEAGLVGAEDRGQKRFYRANLADARVRAFKALLDAATAADGRS
ncbi:MAG: helix-turn-helix domain-containing protein [candidate division WOR-3 bacterium]|nr:helix-turn-helix domain-containing protein [candidate division WOR-3 bacterium]